MGIIFSTGPILQQYIVAFINSDETSIYGSSFQQTVVRLPSFSEWIADALSWPHPIIGFLVVWFSVRSTSFKILFLRFSLFSFLTLSAFDIPYQLIGGDLGLEYLFINIVSNLIGGVIAAGTASFIVLIANYAYKEFELDDTWRRAVGGGLALATSLTVFLITFYIVDFLYRPRPVDVAISAQGNTSGLIVGDVPDSARTLSMGERRLAFVPLSEVQESSGVKWRAASNTTIEKVALPDDNTFNVKVSLYRGCAPTSGAHVLQSDAPSLSFHEVKSLSLNYDWGLWETTVSSEHSSGSLTVTGSNASYFTKKADLDDKTISIEQFVDRGAKVRYSSGSHELDVFAIASMARTEPTMPQVPHLHFKVDQNIYSIEVQSFGDANSNDIPHCQSLETSTAFKQGKVSLGGEILLGISVQISETLDVNKLKAPDNFVEVKGDLGWVKAFGVSPASLTSNTGKRIDYVALTEGVTSVSINGIEKAVRASDEYVAVGDHLDGSFHSGELNVRGKASTLWVNSSRANPTKWETLPTEYRMAIITFAAACFGYLLKAIAGYLNRGVELTWLEAGRLKH